MRKLLSLALALGLAAAVSGLAWAAEPKDNKTQWTGFITDSHCKESGANRNHTADCVDKCLKSGSKAQIRHEGDGNYYNLRDFDSQVRALVGKRVTITGTLDETGKTITVKQAREADVSQ